MIAPLVRRRGSAVAVLAAAVLVAACGGDEAGQSGSDTTTAQGTVDEAVDQEDATTSADAAAWDDPPGDPAVEHVEFFELLADGRPEALTSALELTAPGSLAAEYVEVQIEGWRNASGELPAQVRPQPLARAGIDGDRVQVGDRVVITVEASGAGIEGWVDANLGRLETWFVPGGGETDADRLDASGLLRLRILGQVQIADGRVLIVQFVFPAVKAAPLFVDPADIRFTASDGQTYHAGLPARRLPEILAGAPLQLLDSEIQMENGGLSGRVTGPVAIPELDPDVTGRLTLELRTLRDGSVAVTFDLPVEAIET